MKHTNKIIIALLFVLSISTNEYAYSDYFSSPISPGEEESDKIIGGMVGLGQNIQDGFSYVDCPECLFEKGLGFGYTIGISYEQQITRKDDSPLRFFNIGGLLHISNRDIMPYFSVKEGTYFSDYDFTFPIQYKHTNTISILETGITPYISYNPFKYFFLQAGFDISYIVSNSMEHLEEILDKKMTLPNGEVVDIYFPIPNRPNTKIYSKVVERGKIKNINPLQLAFVPTIGFNIYFNNKFSLSPSFQYYFPLTEISSFGNNFTISAYRIVLALKYNITDSHKIYKKK